MDHHDHVALIQKGIPGPGGVWADFGSGTGAFTLALADLIGPDGIIYSIDKNVRSLRQQEQTMRSRFPEVQVHYLDLDFTQALDLPPLDGAVMANSLHFQREKDSVLQSIYGCLQPGGRLILVEYNSDRGNPWVPYPLSFETWGKLAHRNSFTGTRLLARRPSHFLHEIYSALSYVAGGKGSEQT
jgi:ubiquinone/menaquinone biosynthesis C-methylase UbiE